MKFKFSLLLAGFTLLLSACSSATATAVSTSAPATAIEAIAVPSDTPTAVPPTAISDTATPAPAAITAPIVEAPALEDIHFLNDKDGWGVTETQFLRTNDGGVTWYNVTPSNVTAAGYNAHLFALNNEHVWVQITDFNASTSNSAVYRTSDGGVTWTNFTVPFSSGRLSFLDEQNGWAFGDLGAGAGSDAVAVFQTTDGGATWRQTYANDPSEPNAGTSLPLGGIKSGLTPLNMQTAWVTGIVYSDGTIYVYRTDDGGATWSQLTSMPLPPGAENLQLNWNPPVFVSAQDAFMTMNVPSDSPSLAVYMSHDAGNTWSLSPTLIPSGQASNFLSATDAVIFNSDQFYVTQDAAQTWTNIQPNVSFKDSFSLMDFVDVSNGWVITSDVNSHRSLYRTTDGGATWSPIIP